MVTYRQRPGRRELLGALAGFGVLMLPPGARVAKATGLDVLDMPAIAVRKPTSVMLQGIVRAGNRLIAAGEHGVVIYSDDNGVSWTQGRVPVDVVLTCIAFATDKIGWAAGHYGLVLKTTDGGETWAMQLTGVQVSQLILAAAQAAVAQNSPLPGTEFALRRAAFFNRYTAAEPFLSLAALSPDRVIAFGAYRMTMLSTDGGKSWQEWSLNIPDRLSPNLYATVVIGGNIYLAAEGGLVFCSKDNGQSFVQLASPTANTLFGIVGAADGSLVAFGVAGAIFRSSDNGQSWLAIALRTQDNLTAGRVLATGEILIAGESGGLFASRDNGANFNPVAGVPPISIYDIAQAQDKSLILVGESGIVRLPTKILNS